MVSVVSTLIPALGSVRTLILSGLGAIVLTLGVTGLVLYHQQGEKLEAVRAERDALAADTARLGQSLRSIRAQVGRRNDSLQAMRERADRLRRRVAVAGQRADSVRAWAERDAGRLVATPIGDGCMGAIRWGRSVADSLSNTW